MQDAFDAIDFAVYLRSRWRFVAISCAVALTLAGLTSVLLPKRYTATATLIIQPPAGLDPRAALAVSPVYLESLKTYENFATSDTLFARALDELGLRRKYPGDSIESLKRQVLKVSKPTATRIIEISATLGDPVGAKRMAQYIAEQTVALNRSLDRHSTDDSLKEADASVETAESRLRNAVRAAPATAGSKTVEQLTAELTSSSDLKYVVERDLAQANAQLADLNAQQSAFPAADERAQRNTRDRAATLARIADLEKREKKLEAAVAAEATALQRARPFQDALEAEQRLARNDLETVRTRRADLKASSAFRGERLEILDSGIVPERPSFPNLPLILLVSFVVALPASPRLPCYRIWVRSRHVGARGTRIQPTVERMSTRSATLTSPPWAPPLIIGVWSAAVALATQPVDEAGARRTRHSRCRRLVDVTSAPSLAHPLFRLLIAYPPASLTAG